MSFEGEKPPSPGRKTELLREAREMDREIRREELFRFFVVNKMLSRFENDLDETGFEHSEEEQILEAASHASFDDLYRALSYPYDLRERFLSRIKERVRDGSLPASRVIAEMTDIANKNGYSIGFHLSKFDIRPSQRGWAVLGKEQDHRDDDLPMAYYARIFKWLYRRKLANYMYIVRAEDGHRVSADSRWWRAPTLSIVQQIPVDELRLEMQKLDDEMRRVAKEEGVPLDEEE